MFLTELVISTVAVLSCLCLQTEAGDIEEDYDDFYLSALANDLVHRAEAFDFEMPQTAVKDLGALRNLPPRAQDDEDLKHRVKRLQSFHKDLKQSDFETLLKHGSTLESDVDELMAKHGVTVEMVEGKTEDFQSSNSVEADTDVFWSSISISQISMTTNDQLLKRVEYLENNFHKDDDECSLGTHDCNLSTSQCVNTVGSFTCPCVAGFTNVGMECEDDDECKSGSDDCNKKTTVCVNTVGSFTCQCKEGFSDNGFGCSDGDECKTVSDDCNKETSVCVNTAGSFTCQCKEGFSDNGFGCTADECLTFPVLSGARVIETSADRLKVTYRCNDEFFVRGGGPTATCSPTTGIWNMSTMECAPTECYHVIENYAAYAGTGSTVNGITCQRFDSYSPHFPTIWNTFPYFYRETCLADVNNYCRDPDQEGKPWCYTMSKDLRWAYCDIPKCSPGPGCSIAPFVPGSNAVSLKKFPNGTVAATYECMSGFVPISNLTAVCNGEHSMHEDWNMDKLLCAPTTCYMKLKHFGIYHGTESVTEFGHSCQRWDSQYPHRHSRGNVDYFYGITTLDEVANYCRDLDGEGQPWCYTTDPSIRWGYCAVRLCSFLESKC